MGVGVVFAEDLDGAVEGLGADVEVGDAWELDEDGAVGCDEFGGL